MRISSVIKWVLLLLAIGVNLTGLLSPVWGLDATLYASISKTMVLNKNYVELFYKGKDWLDKPHFPFWVAALSFKFFGFNAWSYKLPAILFTFIGAFYTFLLGKTLYNKDIAYWATLILLTAEHLVISNNDVRAEPYLVGLLIASVYHFYKSYTTNNYLHLTLACLFTACAIMTKGIFAVIPIIAAIGGELIIKKQWSVVFHWRWILAFALVALFILPEIHCLYIQFDLHPEKIVFNSKGISGVRFFFWDSQFGRFFNTGPIKGKGEITFYLHTILWAFLPWAILWYLAVYNFFKKYFRKTQHTEWINISGTLVMLVIFSVSKFQLPHYISILFPFFAITTAQYLFSLKSKNSIKYLQTIQYVVIGGMLLVLFLLHYFFNPQYVYTISIIITPILLITLAIILKQKEHTIYKLVISSILVSFTANYYFNLAFYPSLVKYESGGNIGNYINKINQGNLTVITTEDDYSSALMFSLHQPLLVREGLSTSNLKKPYLFVGSTSIIENLQNNGSKIQLIKSFDDYRITKVTGKFLNSKTRPSTLEFKHLVLIK